MMTNGQRSSVLDTYAEAQRYFMGEGALNNALSRLVTDLRDHNIDYVVMSNKMRDAMLLNNADGGETWILQALDHSQVVWSVEHGDVKLEIDRVNK